MHRALKRKGKAIAKEDSFDVSNVHELVVNGTWDAIMEFEELHKNMCPNPRLARFEGKDGIYSTKVGRDSRHLQCARDTTPQRFCF